VRVITASLDGGAATPVDPAMFMVDGGATHHLCNDVSYFVQIRRYQRPQQLRLADGAVAPNSQCLGVGTIRALHRGQEIRLSNVLLVTNVECSTFSPVFARKYQGLQYHSAYDDQGHSTIFTNQDGDVVLVAQSRGSDPRDFIHFQKVAPEETRSDVINIVGNGQDPAAESRGDHHSDENDARGASASLQPAPPARPQEQPLGSQRGGKTRPSRPVVEYTVADVTRYMRWHARLGHAAPHRMRELQAQGLVPVFALFPHIKCAACHRGKVKVPPYPGLVAREVGRVLEEVSYDLLVPEVESVGGCKYLAVLVDRYSRKVWGLPLQRRSDLPQALRSWIVEREVETGQSLSTLRCDRAGENLESALLAWLKERGVQVVAVPAEHHANNGLAERHVGVVSEMGRVALLASGLPPSLWAEAVGHAIWTKNRLPSASIKGQQPEARYTNRSSVSLDYAVPFGSLVYYRPPRQSKHKFQSRALIGRLLGYDEKVPCYRVGKVDDSDQLTGAVVLTRNITVDDSIVVSRLNPALGGPSGAPNLRASGGSVSQQTDPLPSLEAELSTLVHHEAPETTSGIAGKAKESEPAREQNSAAPSGAPGSAIREVRSPFDASQQGRALAPTSPPTPVMTRVSTRSRDDHTPPSSLSGLPAPSSPPTPVRRSIIMAPQPRITRSRSAQAAAPGELAQPASAVPSGKTHVASVAASTNEYIDTQQQVLRDEAEPRSVRDALSRPEWVDSMNRELANLRKHETFEELPYSDVPRDTQIIPTHPVFRVKRKQDGTIRDLKSRLVANGNLQSHPDHSVYAPTIRAATVRALLALGANRSMAVATGDVEAAYLNAPLARPVYVRPPTGWAPEGRVWRLHKALYGLRESGYLWHQAFVACLRRLGYHRSNIDSCVFWRRSDDGQLSIIALHVDDALLLASSAELLKHMAEEIQRDYPLNANYQPTEFLGMRLTITTTAWYLDQQRYVSAMLERFGMASASSVPTPITEAQQLPRSETEAAAPRGWYLAVVGSILYASTWTRPDLTYAVNHMARFSQDPSAAHASALKRILRYLRGTTGYCLRFPVGAVADIIKSFSDSNHTTSIADTRSISGFAGYLFAALVHWASVRQTTTSLSTAESELTALSLTASRETMSFKLLLEDLIQYDGVPIIYCDNAATLAIATSEQYTGRVRHLRSQHHYARELANDGEVRFEYVSSAQNPADLFTKAVSPQRHAELIRILGLCVSLPL
jgi:hypothetical protein